MILGNYPLGVHRLTLNFLLVQQRRLRQKIKSDGRERLVSLSLVIAQTVISPFKYPVLLPSANGSSRNSTNKQLEQSTSTPASVTVSTTRRRRASQHQPEASTRELRSRSRNNTSEAPIVVVPARVCNVATLHRLLKY